MNGQLMRIETYGICVLPIQWMPVIRTSSGTAYNVLITGIKYIVDPEYKNTFWRSNIGFKTGINNTVDSKTVFQMMVLISGMFLDQVFL